MTITENQAAPGSNKLTELVLRQIEGALRATATQEIAAKRGHISAPTFRDWTTKGQQAIEAIGRDRGVAWQELDEDELLNTYTFHDQPFLHFFLRCERAVVDFVLQNAASIAIAAQDHVVEDTKTTETWEMNKAGELVLTGRVVVTTRRHVQVWQAAAWMLERRFPDLFARTIRQEISGTGGGPVTVDMDGARERLRAKLETMRANDEAAQKLIVETTATEVA